MATLLLTLTSGLNVNSNVITFNSTEADRILTAYQNRINSNGTQADLVTWIANKVQQETSRLVMENETVITYPTPPAMTSTISL